MKKELIRYLIIGVSSVALDFLIFHLLRHSMDVVVANTISFCTAFVFNFFANKFYTFEDFSNKSGRQMLKYGALAFINLLISNTLIWVLTTQFGCNPDISKLLSIALITVWNFLAYKHIVYK